MLGPCTLLIKIEGQEILRAKVSLLHCTTEYPAPYGDVNLKVMDTLAQVGGNKSEAARRLGINRKTLLAKLGDGK